MNRIIVLIFLCINFSQAWSQTVQLKMEIDKKMRAELLEKARDLFQLYPSVTYTINSSDALPSLSVLSDKTTYDEAYKLKYEALHKKDPLNPFYLNQLANYFEYHDQHGVSEVYFKWAYDNMNLSYFEGDTARFYSYRGVLRVHLNDEHAYEDLEKALLINPADSMAMTFYPMVLLMKGEYFKVKLLSEKSLESNIGDPMLPYMYLGLTEVYQPYMDRMLQVDKDSSLKSTFASQDYTNFVTYELTNKYTLKYKDNKVIQNIRPMLDLFALTFKMVFFEQTENGKSLILSYTPNEKKKLKSLIQWFKNSEKHKTLNAYGVNKSLGFSYFLLDDHHNAITYLNKAIDAFPKNKGADNFNGDECYTGLLFIYNVKSDTAGTKRTLLKKIEASDKKNIDDYNSLAYFYYYYEHNVDQAWEWAIKAREVKWKDFKSILLLVHLSYLKVRLDLMDMYFSDANESITTAYELQDLGILASIYAILHSDPAKAYQFFNEVQQAMGEERCRECDEMIDKYLIVRP